MALANEEAPADVEAEVCAPLVLNTDEAYAVADDAQLTAGHKRSRLLRISAAAFMVCAVLAVIGSGKIDAMTEQYADHYADFAKASVGKAVSLAEIPANPVGCAPDGGTCFCPRTLATCKSWKFQVGDVLVFSYGPDSNIELKVVNTVMRWLYQGAVHAAIVTEVNGPALSDIVVTECLKGNKNRIIKTDMNEVLNYRMYHGVWIKRVDATRFTQFPSKGPAIKTWAIAKVGEPFDKALMYQKIILFPWRYFEPHWIASNPDCQQRHKALSLYQEGGPGRWFCSQFVAWTLAFAGGLNTDYGNAAGCATPPWHGRVENLQVAPGDLINQPFYEKSNFHVACTAGCDVGIYSR